MIARILSFSVQARWLVILVTAIVAAYGFYEVTRLPIDALPDITNKQVQINTLAPTLGPEEVEKRVTFPIENALAGWRRGKHTLIFRNRYGQVTAIFRKNQSILHAATGGRAVAQAKQSASGRRAAMGPVSTGLGEIFMYTVEYANPDGGRRFGTASGVAERRLLSDDGRRAPDR
jgi:cobalt-zinc-cadmium resistance protein CzcA